jgi:hypothetical protein
MSRLATGGRFWTRQTRFIDANISRLNSTNRSRRKGALSLWSMSLATARNIAIVLVIAALVAIVPGGGAGANTALQAMYLVFLGTLWWFAAMMYRQHRVSLYSLGDGRRAVLYGALGVAFLTLTASQKLWASPGGTIAWCVLLVASVYAAFAVIWSARQY